MICSWCLHGLDCEPHAYLVTMPLCLSCLYSDPEASGWLVRLEWESVWAEWRWPAA